MPYLRHPAALTVMALLALAACGRSQSQTSSPVGYGYNPALPAPNKTLLPTVKVSPVNRWADGATPKAAEGFQVKAFASGLDHPRWLLVLPNGDVLVAETNGPAKEKKKGFDIRAWFEKQIMSKAGATVPSADRITLLRDANGDGVAEIKTPFLTDLHSPFGMALVGDTLYVANTDAVLAFPYAADAIRLQGPGRKVADLPAGPINHHWTKSLIASKDGQKLYATVGSNSNVGENGIAAEERRAGILEIDIATGASRVFASGIRNPNGMGWNPVTGQLWTAVNERDEIGNDLVPDYMTSVKDGGFYGWPYSYYGQHVDSRVKPQRPDLVAKAIIPDYALGSHTASLGLTFYEGATFPQHYRNGVFIGQHGSWNRKPQVGYKVVFVPFADGKPAGQTEDFLTGFLNAKGEAQGRPVGVTVDKAGALLVADDVGNVIWRVTPAR
ncbi:PQQ-dependent sugar dehydrogenase [Caulobacter sp.]|uniref:PQQ-dependent sugar dehydrogenase n=1 Tax=Caulobacter sp. TaxID=78 RepID=UPI003BAC715E